MPKEKDKAKATDPDKMGRRQQIRRHLPDGEAE